MIDRIRKAQDEDSGFTLIELLVVVIIIGILAAIAIPVFMSQRERAWESELSSDLRNQAMEVEAAATANGGSAPAADSGATPAGFPTDVDDITGDSTTFVNYTASGSTFCLEFSHDDLDDGSGGSVSQAYDSSSDGLQGIPSSC